MGRGIAHPHVVGTDVLWSGLAREYRHPVAGDTEGVKSQKGGLPSHFDELELAHDGVALDTLGEPQYPVGDGEDRIILSFRVMIFPDQKGRRLPGGEMEGKSLDERLNRQIAISSMVLRGMEDRPKGIHHDDPGARRLHFGNNPLQHLPKPFFQHFMRNREKT